MNAEPTKQQELDELRGRVAALESEIKTSNQAVWIRGDGDFYWTYYAWSGAILGMFGAVASLLLNVIGALLFNLHPLRLIQVYLTFPMGEQALDEGLDTGMVLAVGCCLYILTGMVLAIPLHMIIARYLPNGTLLQRLAFATIAGLVLWTVNFYLILAWLQPWLFDGNWISNPEFLPPWIGAGTHLVFAWVVAALYPWGAMQSKRESVSPVEPTAAN